MTIEEIMKKEGVSKATAYRMRKDEKKRENETDREKMRKALENCFIKEGKFSKAEIKEIMEHQDDKYEARGSYWIPNRFTRDT